MPSSQQKSFGPFVLERRIALGGSAEVYLAHRSDGPNRAPLVIKRLIPSRRTRGDDDILTREARLMSLFQHKNIVEVYDAGSIEGEPYIAMEYVDGLDLSRVLRRSSNGNQACPHELACYIVRRVAFALEAAHSAVGPGGETLHVSHGDVCPSNVYLSVTGNVKLGDFGIARINSKRLGSIQSTTNGHVAYLAPEQLTGEAPGPWSDIYALGVILGELLIGEPIFSGSGQLATMLSIRDGNIQPLLDAAPRLPAGILQICERAIARDPSARFATATEFAEALAVYESSANCDLQKSLAGWVSWAKNNLRVAEDLEQQVRESVQFMRAVRSISTPTGSAAHSDEYCRIRRCSEASELKVPVSRLIELLATGDFGSEDEVAFEDRDFEPLSRIPELARHLAPSTSSVTSVLFTPGPPDYVTDFEDVPFIRVLGKVCTEKTTGSLFVLDSSYGRQQRKDLYFRSGRLVHVASSDPQELLGEYLVRKNLLSRDQLRAALLHMTRRRGQLGESLIALRLIDPVDVFNALRNQGRDRVAALCAWPKGTAHLYRNAEPEQVLFPLDLELPLCMVKGAEDAQLQPEAHHQRIVLGALAPIVGTTGSSVPLLNAVPALARKQVSIQTARRELESLQPGAASLARTNACLVVAEALGWIRFVE
jgi:eukaryotic-like serine/threonine-protein kinase